MKDKVNLLNRTRNIYEILICPSCGVGKIIFDEKKENYTCPNSSCGFELTKKQFKELAKVEILSGILFDFNQGEKYPEKQIVFDHHGLFGGKEVPITMTATQRVINYFKALQRVEPDLKGLKLVRKSTEYLQRVINSKGKLELYTNHIDVDSLLSIFCFRNPNYALENEKKIISLSRFNDLMKYDVKVENYYYIFYGIIYLMESEGRPNVEIANFFISNFKDILDNPNKYNKYIILEKELIQESMNVLESVDRDDSLTILSGFKNKVLEFRTPNCFREIAALYEFLRRDENKKYNLPFILKKGVKKGIFSLSVNANVEGYDKIDLFNLQESLYKAEVLKINSIREKNKEIRRLRTEYEKELPKLDQKLENFEELNEIKALRQLLQQDKFNIFYENLQKYKNSDDAEFEEIENIYVKLLQFVTNILEKEEVNFGILRTNIEKFQFNGLSKKLKVLKSDFKKKERQEFGKFLSKISDFKLAMVNILNSLIERVGGDLIKNQKEMKSYLSTVQPESYNYDVFKIWVVKSNMIMTNGEYLSNMTYEEFVIFLRENLSQVANV